MNKSDKVQTATRGQTAFAASEARDKLIHQQIAKERAATDAKTIRLRALRLAKEAEDAAARAANPPKPKAKAKKKLAPKAP